MKAVERICASMCFALALSRCVVAAQAAPAAQTLSLASPSHPAPDEFASEAAVILDSHVTTAMHSDGTGIREQTIAVRLQTDAALRQFGVVSVAFAGSAESAAFVYARVRHHDGSVVETPVTGALEQPSQVTREAPFYSDLKVLQLPIKNLTVGDTIEWCVRVTRSKPEAPGQFWGQESFVRDGVALAETFELHVPAGQKLIVWTNPDTAAPTDTTAGSERTIVWTSRHLVPSTGPAAEAARKKLLTPEQDLALRKGALPSFAWTTFPNWEAVGAWYRGLEADRMLADPAIQAKVTQLTAGKATQAEKAQAIYEYVATQIRYIGVAFGVGRYQPHTAAEVFANQYGDCKDKHTLLASMLTQIGLQPDAVLIGAGVRFNAPVPSPGAFNHLITQIELDGKPVWLDTTAEVAQWGTLTPPIRDQQALVVPLSGSAVLQQTPALPPFNAFVSLTATETLDKDLTSDAHITLTLHDDDEIALRSVLRQISPSQYGEFIQRMLQSLGFGGTASEPEISRPDDLEHPLTLSFRYKRIKEADWGQNRITEPFWPIGLPVVDEKEPPVSSIELGAPRTETSTVDVKLSPGWSAELPEAIHAKAAFATVDTTFHLKDGQVTAERKLTVLQPRVSAADWKIYKKWADEAQFTGYPFLQLISVSAAAAKSSGTDPAPASPNTASAERLIQNAAEALRLLDTASAKRLLDEAKDIDPKARGLWGGYAYLSYQFGEITKATEEGNKELSLHPDEVQMYGLLSALQYQRGEREAALGTLHRWTEAAPNNPDAFLALMDMLHRLKRDGEAIEQGKAALAELSAGGANVANLRIVLASLQSDDGQKAEAAATIRPLVNDVTDLSQQNSVAYMLADAKMDLPGDEATERAVLEKLDAQTGAWTLDEAPDVLGRGSSLLVASWDTMGWVLYQGGHLAEARNFIAAAWENAPRAELEKHLHAVDSALHQPTREESASEQSRRTFDLGPAQGRHGTAEVRLLLAGGKVLRAEPFVPRIPGAPANTAPVLRGATDLVQTADLHRLFPKDSNAHLVRQGIVNCSGAKCQLILEPLSLR